MLKRMTVVSLIAFALAGCQSSRPGLAVPEPEPEDTVDVPLTIDEEARVLRLEDCRELDVGLAGEWMANRSFHHRKRMALALGRIGTASFDDENGNGVKDEGETMAGVGLLASHSDDPNPEVRTIVAFSLGEIGDPAGLSALTSMASGDSNATVRSEAIEALSKLSGHTPLEDYLRYADPAEPVGIRVTTLRYLFRFEGDQALEAARTHLGSEAMPVRRAATYTFSRRAFAPAFVDLVRLLDDDDALIRAYAVRGLARIANPRALGHLLGSVRDAHPWVRTNALRAIASIAAADPGAFEGWATERTLDTILVTAEDPDPGTRATAIETLTFFAPLLEAAATRLAEIAAEAEPAMRESAIRALTRAFVDDQDRIEPLLQTDDRWIKIIVLGETSAASTGPALRVRYANDPDSSVRSAAVGAIPDDHADAEKAIILAALEDPDPIVRASAIERAGKLASIDRKSLARNQEMSARRDALNDARLAALALIAEVEGTDSANLFRELLTDPDPVVRRIAAETIESFGFPRPQYTPLETAHDEIWYREVARWASEPHSAVIETVRGPIEIVLLTGDAPVTTKNFFDLAASGYFDDTSFMRVVPNFVIQGGDPRNDMTGGPGYAIRDEINLQKYTRGAVGMALSGPDTGGSQYFITHSPQHHLDGGYTIFGRVTDGMDDVVDQVRRGDRVTTIRVDAAIKTDEESIRKEARDPLPLEVGPIARERTLETIPEYRERSQTYEPDPTIVSMMAPMITDEDRIEVFLGTWCRDSQREIPRFYKIVDMLKEQGVEIPIEYVAVDRSKTEPRELTNGRGIELVPTIIVTRGGEEIGRIVEAPASLLEDDLLAIFAGAGR